MSNTLAGINLDQIAQKTLDTLLPRLVPFTAFATDFSSDIASEGESVTTRVATKPTSGSLATGYAANAQNATVGARKITLGDVTGLVLGFTDSEWSKSSVNLHNIFMAPGVNVIADGMLTAALNLVTAANFTNAVTYSKAVFNADKVADIAEVLTTAGVGTERSLVLNPGHYGALSKDPAIAAAYAFGGSEVIRTNRIPKVRGFDVYEYATFPTNSEDLAGVAGSKQGLIFAGRVPAVPQGFPGEIKTVTDPDSGFSLQLRKWYSADDGKYYLSMGVIYGVAVGNAAGLYRIKSK